MRRKRLTITIYDGERIVLATSDPVVVDAAMAALEGQMGVPAGSVQPSEPSKRRVRSERKVAGEDLQ